jgi:hypothetical protein
VYNSSAKRADRRHDTGEFRQMPGFQVRVRGEDQPTALRKCEEIRTALSGQVNRVTVTVDTDLFHVHCVSQLGEVLDIGAETPESRRYIATLNGVLSFKEL